MGAHFARGRKKKRGPHKKWAETTFFARKTNKKGGLDNTKISLNEILHSKKIFQKVLGALFLLGKKL